MRIADLISKLRLTKTAFAEKIHVTPQFISAICSGSKIPSDRTISDICREFGVSETWLRTGAGEPFAPPSRGEELGRLVKTLMADKPEAFRTRLITALLRFDADGPEWQLLEDIYNSIAADTKKETDQ